MIANPNGFPGTATNINTGTQPNAVATGDFDGDGKTDIAVTNYGSNTVSILINAGSNSFFTPKNIGVGGGPSGVVTADFNGDGKTDFAADNWLGSFVSVFLNGGRGTGDGIFGAATTTAVAASPKSLASGDFDRDGNADFVVASSNGALSILLGNGAGAFTVSPAVAGAAANGATVGDFNGDANPDIAVALPNNLVSILLGRGDGTFVGPYAASVGGSALSIATADFNRDGLADLAVGTGNGTVSYLRGIGDGTFAGYTTIVLGSTRPRSRPAISITTESPISSARATTTPPSCRR